MCIHAISLSTHNSKNAPCIQQYPIYTTSYPFPSSSVSCHIQYPNILCTTTSSIISYPEFQILIPILTSISQTIHHDYQNFHIIYRSYIIQKTIIPCIYIYTCKYVHIYIYTCKYIYVYVYIYIHVYVYAYIYKYIYIYMYIHLSIYM